MPRFTQDARKKLIAAVQELQAGWKPARVILAFLVEEHGCSDTQARQIIKDANAAWAEVAADEPGKARHVEALGRLARKAEDTLQLGVAVKALAELAKVQGLYEAEKVQVTTADDADRKRLEDLIAKHSGSV